MGDLFGLVVLLVLAVLAAPVLVIVLFQRTTTLRRRIDWLESELAQLRRAASAGSFQGALPSGCE